MTVEFLRKGGINGYFGDGELSQPRGIAIDGDRRVYVADSGNHRIQVFDLQGRFLRKWGTEGEEGLLDYRIHSVFDLGLRQCTPA